MVTGRIVQPIVWLTAAMLALTVPSAASGEAATPTYAPARDDEGVRRSAKPAPARLTLTYNGDVNAVVAGGESRGIDYLGRIGLIGDADLARLIGWHGATTHFSIHEIHGRGLSRNRIGNLLTVSGIEARPALRLFNLWVQQALGGRVTLRLGQITASQEFMISDTANLFVNGTFGWPASFSLDLPSGGPNYPLAAPGMRLEIKPGKATAVRLAVFAGDPAGPGKGDPERRDLHGFNGLRFAGKPFVIAELERSAGGTDPDWSLRLGGWLHFNHFADLRRDTRDGSLAAPASTGKPLMHRGNAGLYGVADVKIWRSAAVTGRALDGFLRASFSPSDRNLIDLYADAGLAITGPFRSRPADIVGIGVAVARISPRLRGLIHDRERLAGAISPIPDFEAVIECSYRAQLATSLYAQPNLQYVIHPNGGMAAADSGTGGRTPDALVIGLRTSARF